MYDHGAAVYTYIIIAWEERLDISNYPSEFSKFPR